MTSRIQATTIRRRGFSVLAQDAARSLNPERAQCREDPALWARAEIELTPSHRRRSLRQRHPAADAAIEVCHQCPLSGLTGPCARWAQLDAYSGVAGGIAFLDGDPIPTPDVEPAA